MHPVEFTWYKGLVLLTSAMGIGFGITNIVYFNRIRINDNCGSVSGTEATTLLYLNIFLTIFSFLLFLWSLYRLVITGKSEKVKIQKTENTYYHSIPQGDQTQITDNNPL